MKVRVAIVAFTVLLPLAGCGHDFGPDNCASPVAAVYTAQCNPYLSRSPDGSTGSG
jgi:hypothetical protein